MTENLYTDSWVELKRTDLAQTLRGAATHFILLPPFNHLLTIIRGPFQAEIQYV